MTEFRKELLERLTKASNTVNLIGGTNIDHHTITGFMDDIQCIEHVKKIVESAKDVDPTFE